MKSSGPRVAVGLSATLRVAMLLGEQEMPRWIRSSVGNGKPLSRRVMHNHITGKTSSLEFKVTSGVRSGSGRSNRSVLGSKFCGKNSVSVGSKFRARTPAFVF